ncbi:sensor histidine kinase [Arthrobacter burdickii]|uniref:histidine kinase n=1 Tax=Arthrobacter burdickii TaxID=3035920 RepID=A0ABT8JWM0_9MICC|nr:HAMP domain-containing sensor histidine kinase [Arthrobacter burdickii]MDN4609555.1 HAMP domain-containing sensor histidine kinase [Arthrobacter burdickii]
MRQQAVLAAVVTMAVILIIAGVILLSVLRSSLLDNARDLAVQRRDTIAEQIQENDPESLPNDLPGDLAGDLAGEGTGTGESSGTQVAQVISPGGTVIATTDASMDDPLYSGEHLAAGQSYLSEAPGLIGMVDVDDYIVAAEGITTPGGDMVVAVGVSTAIERDAISTVGWFLLTGVPVLLALAGTLMWFLVGRALRPVERIRSTVAGISHQHLDERVEVPPTRDEIERLATTMNGMLARLQSADAAQRRFVTDASHELRSPLATLTTGLEIAAADSSDVTWRETSAMLQTQALRMGYLVEDLLTLAKIDDAGLKFVMQDVDLDDLLLEELNRLKSVSRHAIHAHIEPVRITADPHRITQVIRNLLNNADRHAASTISINLSNSASEHPSTHASSDASDSHGHGQAILTIDNDGDRIPETQRERVFERFVRLDESRTRESGGSGLGLAISKNIIRAHAGTILATENTDGHTRFVVTLPLQSPSAIRPKIEGKEM